jgi:hypothetical protein
MVEYPADKGLHVWTDSIVQISLSPSLKERLDAVNRIAGIINMDIDAPFLLQQAADIEKALHVLPAPLKLDAEIGHNGNAPGKLFAKVLLNVYLRRPSFNIYRAVALSPVRNRYPEARRGAIRSAIELLSHLDTLDPTVADLNVIKDRDLLNLFHVVCKNDIIQCAHFLCYEIQQFGLQSDGQSANAILDDGTWTKPSLTRIVENTLNSLLQRLGQFGSDLKDVLPLSIVLQSVRSGGTRDEKIGLMMKGAERVWKACLAEVPSISTITAKGSEESRNEKGKAVCTKLKPFVLLELTGI